jgi:cytochrome c oxidase subunit 3
MAEAHAKQHDYHLVNPSPWPIIGAIGGFTLAVGAVMYFVSKKAGTPNLYYVIPGLAIVIFTMFGWWRDVIKEAQEGYETPVVQLHLRYGMILFIASEVMFFVAWFWAYFDAALYPDDAVTYARTAVLGGQWPPIPSADTGVSGLGDFQHTFNPWGLPLVNTLILLLSGTTVTWAHHSLLENDRRGLVLGLLCTVILGIMFTSLQAYEYVHAGFGFANHIYAEAAFRLRGRRLVLALRRRGVAVPVHLHLCVGRRDRLSGPLTRTDQCFRGRRWMPPPFHLHQGVHRRP